MCACVASSLPLLQLVIASFRKKFLTRLFCLIYSPLDFILNSYRIIGMELRKTATIAAMRKELAFRNLSTSYSGPILGEAASYKMQHNLTYADSDVVWLIILLLLSCLVLSGMLGDSIFMQSLHIKNVHNSQKYNRGKVSHQHQDLCESNLILQVSPVNDYESVTLIPDHLGDLEAFLWDTQNQTPIAFLSSLAFSFLHIHFIVECFGFAFCHSSQASLQPGGFVILKAGLKKKPEVAGVLVSWPFFHLLCLIKSLTCETAEESSSLNTSWTLPFFKFLSFKGLKIQSSYSSVTIPEQTTITSSMKQQQTTPKYRWLPLMSEAI